MIMVISPYADALATIPQEHREVTVSGLRTHYWVYGPPDAQHTLVLVHGFRGDHHGLEPIVAHLHDCRLIVPDLPGFGLSEPFTSGPHDLNAYAEWLTTFVQQTVPGGTATILGHSFGSIVAAAALSAGLVAPQAILINPIAAPALKGPRGILSRLAVFYYWLGAALPERLGTALLGNRGIVRGLSILMAKTRDRDLRRWIHDQHHRYFASYASRQVVLESFTASVSNDVSEFAGQIDIPVLLIGADRDDITSVAAQEMLREKFTDAELVMITNVGHLIHYEAPTQAATAIERRLSRSR